MHRLPVVALVTLAVSFGFAGCGSASGNPVLPQFPPSALLPQAAMAQHSPKPAKSMRTFSSEAELTAYLKQLEVKLRRVRQEGVLAQAGSLNYAAPAAAPAKDMAAGAAEQESVTNVQHAGVDEGSIVKLHGDHLLILRRGRLFTVAIGGGDLTPISAVDAYGPDVDPSGTWYDEMLVSKDTVAVIGYSYQRGGSEVGLFNIDSGGSLTYRSTYQLRSNDYYSSRNYASRLIGNKLIFYSPLYMNAGGTDPSHYFPGVRRWHKGATDADFHRILPATQVYVPTGADFSSIEALHTVMVCDLAGGGFDCKATSVIGPPGRVFYVSPESVYVWMTDWAYGERKPAERSMLYRVPLDGSAPSALKVSGSPVDQFSFLASGDGHLNVLVRSNTSGDGMWGAERAAGSVALMRIAVDSFSDGSEYVPAESYRKLPTPQGYTFQNRFVGDYLLYGTGSGWGDPRSEKANLYAVPWAGGEVQRLALTHGVDRIEQMGPDAVVVGTDGRDLHFAAVRLGYAPEVADEYVRKGASQGELRSHGFFYKPDSEDSGMLGLPIALPARAGYRHLFENSAGILFLRNDNLHFEEVGELYAEDGKAADDSCHASCVDWYGNAQPLFIRGRVLALLGYELVEGHLSQGQLHETRRVNFASQIMAAKR
jgi:hypothetical protein